MITHLAIPPHELLSFFIDRYVLSSSGGSTVAFSSSGMANHETCLAFFLMDKPVAGRANSNVLLIGPQTHCHGSFHFQGVYHTFVIHFRAAGYHKIFGLPAVDTVNRFFPAPELPGIWPLFERLRHTGAAGEMAALADEFLLAALQRQCRHHARVDGIALAASMMYPASPLAIADFARLVFMSTRNFERSFTGQVGIPPKLYCRLMRFNEAMTLKQAQPEKTWTSIAYDCRYFDQMHFIRECREFSGRSPGDLFRHRPEAALW